MQLVLFATICLIWGATWVASKFVLAAVPPLMFAGTRFVVAGSAMLIFLYLRGEVVKIRRADLVRFALVIMTLVVGCYSLLFWGMLYVSSGVSAVLNLATLPIALLTIGLAAGEESFAPRKAVAILCGTFGLVLLFAQRIPGTSESSLLSFLGAVACASSAVAYAFGSVTARPLLRRYSSVLITGVASLAGGCILTLLSVALEPGGRAALAGDWGLSAWLGWLFMVLFGSLCATTMYMQLLRDWGPARAGTYAFVSPIVAVLLGAAVFAERLTFIESAGMATMLAGAWLSLVPAKAKMKSGALATS